ncbi:M36 family metallopeptidase [Fibrella sp. WM1]|uniref:M36 family metallopeptidase n=1 Tax=Fibrella musci TaxID=3242485 RepID=UPI0035209DA9
MNPPFTGRTPFAAILLTLLCLAGYGAYAQAEIETAKQYVRQHGQAQAISPADVDELIVSSAYLSPTTGWYHVYFNQGYQSIEVYNRLMNVVLAGGQVTYLTHNFVPNSASLPNVGSRKNTLTPLEVLKKATTHVGMPVLDAGQVREISTVRLGDGTLTKTVYAAAAVSSDPINVKLYWLPMEVDRKGESVVDRLQLTWNVTFLTPDGKNRWSIHLDANTGEVVRQVDEVIHCDFGAPAHTHGPPVGHSKAPIRSFGLPAKSFAANSYTVFDYPLESPSFGTRTVSTNPYTRFVPGGTGPGATNGWHTDGTTSYTITRGNNVWAQEDANANDGVGVSPASATLEFDFPYTQGLNTAAANQSAAITNLFYWSNVIHDVLWRYGFDEPSGNFQQTNQGRGGAGNDYVLADAQDGAGTNNANFSTPPDGGNGRMQMYLWTGNSYQPDGDFDNGIISHEYGHGWSVRLTGGPANVSCLQNIEQPGEGWSDYLALMLTTNWSSLSANVASANLPRSIGTYVVGQPTTGSGIRLYRYSYDKANINNPVTYAKVGDVSFSRPHGIGSIWATMLWDMTWEIILQDGQIEANVYSTPASVTAMRGNVAALKLVNEGLRLQPCSPSFVQARDAILQADQLLFNGRYRCAIGRAFARRGLGANASTGSSSNDRIVIEDFTPIDGANLSSPTTATICTGTVFAYTATSGTSGLTYAWSRPAVSGISNASATANGAVVNEMLVNTTNAPITVIYSFSMSPNACGTVSVVPVTVLVSPIVTPTVGAYSICQNATVPAGQGLVVPVSLLGTLSGTLTTSSPTYAHATGDNVTTYAAGSTVYYRSYTFTAPASGTQTFEITAASLSDGGNNDTYLSLYQTAFNPANPGANFLRGDDDSGADRLSKLTHLLVQGTTYIVVVSAYNNGITGSYTLQASAPVFAGGTPNWFTSASGGSAIFTGPVFNPVGVAGSGVPNTATPGTTTFYVSTAESVACRRATTFTIQTTAPPTVASVTITQGSSVVLSASGCTGATAVLRWYQTVGDGEVSMPVSPTATTQYYARCQRTTGSLSCLSDKSLTSTVTVMPGTFVESVASGPWNAPSTWNCNCIPNGTLPIRVLHTVTVPDAYTGQAKGIRFGGNGRLSVQGSGQIATLN